MSVNRNGDDKPSIIKENTLVPISLLVVILAGVLRVESTTFKANASEKEIEYLKVQNHELSKVIVEVKLSLSRIEGKLDIIQLQRSPDGDQTPPEGSFKSNK